MEGDFANELGGVDQGVQGSLASSAWALKRMGNIGLIGRLWGARGTA